MSLTRRRFLRQGAVVSGALLLGDPLAALLEAGGRACAAPVPGLGPLVPDPEGILDLPAGFSYRLLSAGQRGTRDHPRWNQKLTNGDLVPGAHDGMAAFPGADGGTILVRNHELLLGEFPEVDPARRRRYDPAGPAGTTTLWVRRDRTLARHFASLSGTVKLCSGGATPWRTWLACEESTWTPGPPSPESADQQPEFTRRHGYVFEVPAAAEELVEPVPIATLGRFCHEAAAVDPATGLVYMTEDRQDSLLYRFRPAVLERGGRRPAELRAGDLAHGGTLEALAIAGRPRARTANRPRSGESGFPRREPLAVEWVPIPEPDPAIDLARDAHDRRQKDPLKRHEMTAPGSTRAQGAAAGAAVFDRGEGMALAGDHLVFSATGGGRAGLGQLWRLDLRRQTIELLVEPAAQSELDGPDNLTVAPWGDLIVCEDGQGTQRLVGVAADASLYDLARNALNDSELCGACFSPDGDTLFVNLMDPGITFAVWGPWPAPRRG